MQICVVYVGPGISSYANNTALAGKSLIHCLDHAADQIPKDKHKDTPVYLGATAGMRLLQSVF
jgi:Golgi nucleoside diphosphatase